VPQPHYTSFQQVFTTPTSLLDMSTKPRLDPANAPTEDFDMLMSVRGDPSNVQPTSQVLTPKALLTSIETCDGGIFPMVNVLLWNAKWKEYITSKLWEEPECPVEASDQTIPDRPASCQPDDPCIPSAGGASDSLMAKAPKLS
jgi:hypothetical protein